MVFVSNDRHLSPRSSFYTKVPPPTGDPDKGELIQVCFSKAWLPYILGSLEQLINPYTWKTADSAELQLAEQRANQLLYMFQTAKLCNTPIQISGGTDGDELLIRQNPDNPCILETSINGTEWCQFADFSLCLPGIGQPGGEQHQPAPDGGDVCYKGQLDANDLFLVPTIVSTGDVIELTSVSGAASSDGIVWVCPNGQNYFAGICNGSIIYNMADPLPGSPHMCVLVKLGGTYYDLSAGPFTVPGGITNAPVVLQMNIDDLGDGRGGYDLEVCVTNNQSTGFTHVFDFLGSDCGFVSSPVSRAVWTAGQGWGRDPAGVYPGLFQIQSPVVASRAYNFWQAFLSEAVVGFSPGVGVGISDYTGTVYSFNPYGALNPSQSFANTTGTAFWSSIQADGRDSGGGGAVWNGKLQKLIVKGNGTDPF